MNEGRGCVKPGFGKRMMKTHLTVYELEKEKKKGHEAGRKEIIAARELIGLDKDSL
jgi:hypothetical protein